MFTKTNKLSFQSFLNTINFKFYIFLILIFEIIAVYLSYKNLFNYEGCTNVVFRDFNLFNNFISIPYPEMCDESFYFHGFQWINHIYENGYVYQDRPLYLGIGFIIYRFFFIFSLLFGFLIEPISLLLLSSLILQIIIVNLIAYVICKTLKANFDRFYFLIFLLLVIFSFEYRLYLFLPTNSTTYLLIFAFSIYSIKNKKLSGFMYGLLFTISAYGIIGFLYELLTTIYKRKKSVKTIIKNIILFLIPYIGFELIRVLLGFFQGKEYGVKYIHAAEAEEYQQFVWFIQSLFNRSYEPFQNCHTLTEFIPCYFDITLTYFSISLFYISLCLLLFFFTLIRLKKFNYRSFSIILSFTIFNYIFISLQGFYVYRFVYYSIGFGVILLTCLFLVKIDSELLSILSVIATATYTLSRNNFQEYTLDLNLIDSLLIITIICIFIYDFFTKRNKYTVDN